MSTSNVITPSAFRIIILFSIFFFLSPASAFAAKQRVWSTQATTKKTVSTATKPTFSVKFRSDRRAINIYFSNLNTASSTAYELTYNGNGIDQGVVGSTYANEGSSATRLLLFGTCSKVVCTYHKNIQSAQLKITSKLNSGKTYIKTYRIKI